MNSDFKDQPRCSSLDRVNCSSPGACEHTNTPQIEPPTTRPRTIGRALAGTVLLLQAGLVFGDAESVPGWVNSYVAGEQCYCAPELDAGFARKVLPTPIGGQSVAQICKRIGQGPTLTLTGDTFSHPVYTDAQCGHGPTLPTSTNNITTCDGQTSMDASDCAGQGPTWDLVAAYSRPVVTVDVSKAAASTPTKNNSQPAAVTTASTPDVVRPKKQPDRAAATKDEPPRLATIVKTVPLTPKPDPKTSAANDIEALPLATVVSERPLKPTKPAPIKPAKPKPRVATVRQPVEVTPVAEPSKPVSIEAQVETTAAIATPEITSDITPETAPEITAEVTTAETGTSEGTDTEDAVAVVTDNQIESAPIDVTNSAARVATPLQAAGDSGFVSLLPTNYNFGGAGLAVGGGFAVVDNWMLIARAAAANTYTEARVGAQREQRLASLPFSLLLAAGLEYGRFDWSDAELDDGGVFASGALGYQFSPALTGAAGLNISTFFEGDPSLFGQMAWRFNRALSLTGQAELGDNDNVGVGVVFNY